VTLAIMLARVTQLCKIPVDVLPEFTPTMAEIRQDVHWRSTASVG
jgi:hypothetical protein